MRFAALLSACLSATLLCAGPASAQSGLATSAAPIRTVKVAAVQFVSEFGRPDKNRPRLESLIRQAAAAGARVVVLPETAITGYTNADPPSVMTPLRRLTDMLIMGLESRCAMSKVKEKNATGYPHIVKIKGVCGGEAIIEDTRIAVWHVVGYYYRVGMSIEEILADWDYLAPAQVFSALAYYHDNKDEVDRVREKNSYEAWLDRYTHAVN